MPTSQHVAGLRPISVITLLVLTWFSVAFGNSLQPISVLAWLHPLILLATYDASVSSFRSTILAHALVIVVQALGFTFGFAGAISFPSVTSVSLFTTLVLGLLFSCAKTLGALYPAWHLRHLAAQLAQQPTNDDLSPVGRLLLVLPLWSFPILSSAVNTLAGTVLGRFADPAIPLLDWPAVTQLASIFGLWGVGFLQDLASSSAYIFLCSGPLPLEPRNQLHHQHHQPHPHQSRVHDDLHPVASTASAAADGIPAASASPPDSRVCPPLLRRHVLTVAAVLVALVALGGGLVYSDSFYQRPVEQELRREQRLPVSCLTAQTADVGSGDYLWLWQKTAERVAAGDRFVLWSEAAVIVRNDEEELGLLTSARDLLAAHGYPGGPAGPVGTYLGLCYERVRDDAGSSGSGSGSDGAARVTNQFALIDPNGTLLWNYHKAHPVPYVEANVVPGPAVLPTAPSPYGNLGGSICFDMDWPSYVRQAGTARVALMLQPSWTWGAVGPRHFLGDMLRAVENGFTTFRCSSSGVSGAISPRGAVWHYLLTGPRDVLSFSLPLHPRSTTVYVAGGWLAEWLNLAAAAALVALAVAPRKRLTAWVEPAGRGSGEGILAQDREPLLPQ